MTNTGEPGDGNAPGGVPETSLGPGGTINIGEDFGAAKSKLPPVATIALAIFAVMLAGGIFAYFQQAKPRAGGSIESVTTAQVLPDQITLAAINIALQNTSGKPLWIRNIRVELQTAKGEQTADAMAAMDFQRFYTAFPALQANAQPALSPEDKIQPGESVKRTVLVGFHTTSEEFTQRKSLSVVILPYDEHVEIVLK